MSKIALKIGEALLEEGWLGDDFDVRYASEAIDRALEGKTIKKSEVDGLRNEVEALDAEANGLCDELIAEQDSHFESKAKLAAAEKELASRVHHVIPVSAQTEINDLKSKLLDEQNLSRAYRAMRDRAQEDAIKFSDELAVAYKELNTYKQAEEVENKLDSFYGKDSWAAGWVNCDLHDNPYAGATWTWRGEPAWRPETNYSVADPMGIDGYAKATKPGGIVETTPCDICGVLDPPGGGHAHAKSPSFWQRLKFRWHLS